MGVLNFEDNEKQALRAIDERELDKLIDQAIRDEHSGGLSHLHLSHCGLHVSGKFSHFTDDLSAYREAKSPKKRGETGERVRRAGSELLSALGYMKRRMEVEDQEGRLFYVFDDVFPPRSFGKDLVVRISYRWRRAVEDEWTQGSIAFHHSVEPRPVDFQPRPKRKPSAAKQARDLQDNLGRTWEHLRNTALFTLRDYFRGAGDGSKIPKTFQARTDSYTRELNNYSARFWLDSAGTETMPRGAD